jgi:glycerol uptake facilitator-like aquaporin
VWFFLLEGVGFFSLFANATTTQQQQQQQQQQQFAHSFMALFLFFLHGRCSECTVKCTPPTTTVTMLPHDQRPTLTLYECLLP